MIGAVRQGASPARHAALESLIARYWHPAYAHLRAKGIPGEDTQDLVQGFFEKWLRQNLFGRAEIGRGRFRDYMLTSLNNFARNALRDKYAKKRWPEAGFSVDDVDEILGDGDPADEFVRTFISEMTLAVLAELEQEFAASDKSIHFFLFRRRIVEPVLDGVEPPSYRTLAEEFELSEKQAANFVVTARRAYVRLLEAHVSEYAASAEDSRAEIAELLAYLGIAT